MTPQSSTDYLLTHHPRQFKTSDETKEPRTYTAAHAKAKKQRITKELKALGITSYGLLKMETRQLPRILHDNEHVQGIVYGHHVNGSAMLVATDRRVMFIDKKPFFMNSDEVTYDIVSGVSYGKVGLFATVNLHTRIGDYKIRTMNARSARIFIDFIEQRCLEHMEQRRDYD